MKKTPIKVIKKRSRAISRAIPVGPVGPVSPLRSDPEINVPAEGDMAIAVERWIGERRENRRVESVFSDTQLATWKQAPDTSK